MCIIIDANLAGTIFSNNTSGDFYPLINWLTKKDGKLVVGGQLSEELDQVSNAKRFIKVLSQAGKARTFPSDFIIREENLIASDCESDDSHIIALARLSGARILCSNDQYLHRDFTNLRLICNPKGHIYQSVSHSHLLQKYGHTKACRRTQNL